MKRIRILTAKFGFDIHNRGINVVNRAFRDSGMEVIFIGNQFPEIIAETALQENVDVIGAICLNSATSIEFMTSPNPPPNFTKSFSNKVLQQFCLHLSITNKTLQPSVSQEFSDFDGELGTRLMDIQRRELMI